MAKKNIPQTKPMTREKHESIYRLYESLRRQQREDNPRIAEYLPISYYASIISEVPEIGLSKSYIQRILRYMITHDGHAV